MTTQSFIGLGAWHGLVLGAAYVVNVQLLTWAGLGLTGWVYAIDVALLGVAWIAMARRLRSGGATGDHTTVGVVIAAVALVVVSGFVQQLYMVLYVTTVNPGWVDGVVEIRRQLLEDSGAPADQIGPRIDAVRLSFRPMRMLTSGLLMPSLWKLVFVGGFGIVARLARKKR